MRHESPANGATARNAGKGTPMDTYVPPEIESFDENEFTSDDVLALCSCENT
ncbi:MAG: hypothetical protein JXR94_16250 [Candidatus Hydrogenedentes bacterium]|nr:hypothetical protein [Candidatus Hydrogenedentota bacterium]